MKKSMNTIFFFLKKVPSKKRPVYAEIVCKIWRKKEETQLTKITVEENLIEYSGKFNTPMAYLITDKILFKNVISTKDTRFMNIDIKNFYLNMNHEEYEYM